jgi:hypothetical protein
MTESPPRPEASQRDRCRRNERGWTVSDRACDGVNQKRHADVERPIPPAPTVAAASIEFGEDECIRGDAEVRESAEGRAAGADAADVAKTSPVGGC